MSYLQIVSELQFIKKLLRLKMAVLIEYSL